MESLLKRIPLYFFSLAFCLAANAEIIDLGKITRDTQTGLDWLDVSETMGLSYFEVIAEMDEGGAYEGWRYPTLQEIDQLISNFGYVPQRECINIKYCDKELSGDSALIEYMITVLGDTRAKSFELYGGNQIYNAGEIFAINGARFGEIGVSVSRISDQEIYDLNGNLLHDFDDIVSTAYRSYSTSQSASITGSFLVTPTVIPLPASIVLFSTCIASVLGLNIKEHALG